MAWRSLVVWLHLLVVCAGLSACSPSIDTDEERTGPADTDTTEIPQVNGADQPKRVVSIFPEHLEEDLRNLQQAIDIKLGQDVTECMSRQGWQYILPGNGAGPPGQGTPSVAGAIETVLGASTSSAGDPNSAYLARLESDDRNAWVDASHECTLSSEWNVGHPFTYETGLLATMQREASDLVQADPRRVASESEAQRCFAAEGHGGSSDAAVEQIQARVAEAIESYSGGLVSRDETLNILGQLADDERLILAAIDKCFSSYHRLLADLYDEHLNQIAAANGEIPFLVAEIEAVLSNYADVLSELRVDN